MPLLATATAASVLPTRDSAMPASPQNSSSNAIGMPSPLGSSHCAEKKSSEYRPILAASSRMGQGVSSRSSHSAAGRPDHVRGEPVHPVAHLAQVGPGLEGESAGGVGAVVIVLLGVRRDQDVCYRRVAR